MKALFGLLVSIMSASTVSTVATKYIFCTKYLLRHIFVTVYLSSYIFVLLRIELFNYSISIQLCFHNALNSTDVGLKWNAPFSTSLRVVDADHPQHGVTSSKGLPLAKVPLFKAFKGTSLVMNSRRDVQMSL